MFLPKTIALTLLAVLTGSISAAMADEGPFNGEFRAEGFFGIEHPLSEEAPVKATADWTMNVWVRPDGPSRTKTLIAGFGNISSNSGQQRYFANFDDGLRFWGGSLDVSMKTPLEPGRWQMLTAVHAAGTLKLYKEGKLVATQPVTLTDAEPQAHLGPNSPWPGGNHFGGRIARFILKDRALSDSEIHALQSESQGLDQLKYPKGAPDHWGVQTQSIQLGTPNQDPASFPKSSAPPSPPRKASLPVRAALVPDREGGWILAGPWKLAAAPKVREEGAALSKAGFRPVGWYDATVPGTVLTTLVNQGVYPDPYFGLNNLAIPESLNKQDYWYRLEFAAPKIAAGQKTSLIFNGINYRAEVWLNGQRLGEILGAFKRGTFDVSGILKQEAANALAIRISPPPHPGIPHEQSMAAGTGPNGGAAVQDGPTFFCSEGWDWIPGIRDRDSGIWQDVVLKTTGAVTLGDPQVITRIPEPVGSRADVTVAIELTNLSNAAQSGLLKGSFEGVAFEKPVTLAGGARQIVQFTPREFPQLAVAKPRLWWPNGYGRPDLYHLSLGFQTADGKFSEVKNLRFGMREISVVLSALDTREKVGRYEFFPAAAGPSQVIKNDHQSLSFTPNGWVPSLAANAEKSPALRPSTDTGTERYLVIKVNGQRIPIRGGNWGMDDAMKQVSRERLEPYIRLQRDANFNTIRNWCGQSTEETFYELCDEYGILIWNEFWLTTENNNMEPSAPQPLLANAEDTIKRFRNHPSIAIWCGRNEGVPPPAINEGLEALIRKYDGTRYYQPNSIAINLLGSGPWSYLDPVKYFTENGKGFTTELGLPSPLTADSIRSMMAPQDLWPPNDVWAYHDWVPSGAMDVTKYLAALAARYGEPSGFEDFVRKTQMMNYVSHRAMYEGLNASLWKPATGRLMWMSHPSWPSMVWQIYGWDYQPNASFYGVKKACEPVHIQMNLPDYAVLVTNTTTQPLHAARIKSRVFDFDGKLLETNEAVVEVPADGIAPSFTINAASDKTVRFVKLELRDSRGKLLSENFYWQAPADADYLALDHLPRVPLTAKSSAVRNPTGTFVTIQLANPSKTVALMTFLTLRDAKTGQRILPAYASDNYVSLLPGEKRVVTFECPLKISQAPLAVTLEGWNIERATIAVGGS